MFERSQQYKLLKNARRKNVHIKINPLGYLTLELKNGNKRYLKAKFEDIHFTHGKQSTKVRVKPQSDKKDWLIHLEHQDAQDLKNKIPLHLATAYEFLSPLSSQLVITLHMKSTPTPLVAVTLMGGLWRTWPMPWIL